MKESPQGTLWIFSCMRKRCSFRKTPYFPPGHNSLGALLLRIQHPAGSAGTTMVGIVELLYRLSWWPDDRPHGIYSSPIHP